MNRNLTPVHLITFWLVLLILLWLIIVPLTFFTSVGGEQVPLTVFAYLILAGAYGTLLIAIFSPFFYKKWFFKYWYINVAFCLLSGFYVVKDQTRRNESPYSFQEEITQVNGTEIKIKREYYSFKPLKIRSESFWKDGKKDSTWTIFNEDGRLKSQQRYKNNQLVEEKD